MQSEFYKKASRIIKPQYIQMMKYYIDANLYGIWENAQDKRINNKQTNKKTFLKKKSEKFVYLSMPVRKCVAHTQIGSFSFIFFTIQVICIFSLSRSSF